MSNERPQKKTNQGSPKAKRLLFVGAWLGILVCLFSGCNQTPRSPRIVCDLDGKVVSTSFTFAEFKQMLATEHGQVEATEYEQLVTPSLVLFFKPLANGSLLAERVLVRQSGKELSPAIFFGLKKGDPEVMQAASSSAQGTNGPAFVPTSR